MVTSIILSWSEKGKDKSEEKCILINEGELESIIISAVQKLHMTSWTEEVIGTWEYILFILIIYHFLSSCFKGEDKKQAAHKLHIRVLENAYLIVFWLFEALGKSKEIKQSCLSKNWQFTLQQTDTEKYLRKCMVELNKEDWRDITLNVLVIIYLNQEANGKTVM